MSNFKLAFLSFTLLTLTGVVSASESGELREKAESIQREAAGLAEHGHTKEAENLERKALAMLEEAERLDQRGPDQRKAESMRTKKLHENRVQEAKERVMKQREKKRNEQRLATSRREAERGRKHLPKISQHPRHGHDAPQDNIGVRLNHMRFAMEHLKQAGLHEMADHVAERAEAAERELREQHKDREHQDGEHQDGDVMHKIMQQLDQLSNELGRLRRDVDELRRER